MPGKHRKEKGDADEDELRREYEERQEGEEPEEVGPDDLPKVPPFSRS